jgi:hypothetical protein
MGPVGFVVVFLAGAVLGLFGTVALVVAVLVLPLPGKSKGKTSLGGPATTGAPLADSATSSSDSVSSSLGPGVPVAVVGGIISGPGIIFIFIY